MRIHRHEAAIAAILCLLASGIVRAQEDSGQDPYLAWEERFVRIVRELRPSVVTVTCVKSGAGPEILESRTALSGIVFDGKGHVATFGGHAAGASKIEVGLLDGRTFPAALAGYDEQTGIAVLRIEDPPDDLVPVRLGDSDRLEVGATLVAVGNPFGFRQSVSTGIVSGLDRVIHGYRNTFTGMIQSTVPVNPGDAGGLVANSRGECVGIIASTFGRTPNLLERLGSDRALQEKVRKFQESLLELFSDPALTPEERFRRAMERLGDMQGALEDPREGGDLLPAEDSSLGAQSINFVMPINAVRWVVEGLIKDGKVTRGWLGVGVDVRPEAGREAVYLSKVVEDGPGAEAGLAVGDRIVAFLGEEIDRVEVLRRLIARTPPGKKIVLLIDRNGERLRLEIVMGENK
ncbi:MAG: trypsin-like peptidase domain-containing protein [Planctomycetes bacterium]|nr:trypsin-like peptidase domain-containing protein [Planctomycetota bacterium]